MTSEAPLTITKKELVHRIAEETRQTKVVVKEIVQRFLDEIVAELEAGNRLEFREFGVFEIRQRASRLAQNPRTLEKVEVPARRVVKFKAGRLMRQKIGGDGAEDFEDEDEEEMPRPRRAPRERANPAPASRAVPEPPPATPAPSRPPPKPPSNSPF